MTAILTTEALLAALIVACVAVAAVTHAAAVEVDCDNVSSEETP